MRGINKVILLGLVGADPELSFTTAGLAICKLSIATHRFQKKQGSTEREQVTDWHNIVVFDRSGEDLKHLVHKGDVLYVEGELRVRRWTNERTQEKGCTVEIIASEWERAPNRGEEIPHAEPPPAAEPEEPAPAAAARDVRSLAAGDDGLDDDLPF